MTRKASHEAIMLCTESLFEIPEFQALPADRFLLETSVPGIFAVEDVRSESVKRVASSVGEGSICVQFVPLEDLAWITEDRISATHLTMILLRKLN
jgi:hypothetical protein